MKWWLTYPKNTEGGNRKWATIRALELYNPEHFPRSRFSTAEYNLEFQTFLADGHRGIFVVKARKNDAGRRYNIGLDT